MLIFDPTSVSEKCHLHRSTKWSQLRIAQCEPRNNAMLASHAAVFTHEFLEICDLMSALNMTIGTDTLCFFEVMCLTRSEYLAFMSHLQ